MTGTDSVVSASGRQSLYAAHSLIISFYFVVPTSQKQFLIPLLKPPPLAYIYTWGNELAQVVPHSFISPIVKEV